jgi:putative ABC transport system permease protein
MGTTHALSTHNGVTVSEKVAGVYENNNLLGPWLVTGDVYRTLVPRNEWSDIVGLVKASPGMSLPTLRHNLEKATDPYYIVNVQNRDEFKGSLASQVNGLLGLLYGLLGLAIVIAILGIVNTLALSVVERRREIGMLRAVGMQRKQVRRTIYVESLLIAVFGAVLGLILGLSYGSLFTRTLHGQGLDKLSVPFGQAAAFLVVAGVVGVLAALWPGVRAARTPPLEAISSS